MRRTEERKLGRSAIVEGGGGRNRGSEVECWGKKGKGKGGFKKQGKGSVKGEGGCNYPNELLIVNQAGHSICQPGKHCPIK